MNKVVFKYLLFCLLVLGTAVWWQQRRIVRLSEERDCYQGNTEALLSDMKRMQVDSATTAVDVKSLRLTVGEYKRLRAEDAETIGRLGVKIKHLEVAARHDLEVSGSVDAVVRDTVVVRDTLPVKRQKVEMITPYIRLTGLIENGRLKGEIQIPVTLHQGIWIEYKRRWLFWKKVKAVHQTISSDNPYVRIKYSEYIQIRE
mgnify:CR=1 FL=1